MTCPVKPISGCPPTTSNPAIVLLAARSATIAVEYVAAARHFPVKKSDREHDRVRTVFQVPWPSSLEKMSPATTLDSTGKPAIPANPNVTNGMANPETWIQRPNRVSPGNDDCRAHEHRECERPDEADGCREPREELRSDLHQLHPVDG